METALTPEKVERVAANDLVGVGIDVVLFYDVPRDGQLTAQVLHRNHSLN